MSQLKPGGRVFLIVCVAVGLGLMLTLLYNLERIVKTRTKRNIEAYADARRCRVPAKFSVTDKVRTVDGGFEGVVVDRYSDSDFGWTYIVRFAPVTDASGRPVRPSEGVDMMEFELEETEPECTPSN